MFRQGLIANKRRGGVAQVERGDDCEAPLQAKHQTSQRWSQMLDPSGQSTASSLVEYIYRRGVPEPPYASRSRLKLFHGAQRRMRNRERLVLRIPDWNEQLFDASVNSKFGRVYSPVGAMHTPMQAGGAPAGSWSDI